MQLLPNYLGRLKLANVLFWVVINFAYISAADTKVL